MSDLDNFYAWATEERGGLLVTEKGGAGSGRYPKGSGEGDDSISEIPSTHSVKREYTWREDAESAIKDYFKSRAGAKAKPSNSIRVKKTFVAGPLASGNMLYKHSSGGESVYHLDKGGSGHEVYSEQ